MSLFQELKNWLNSKRIESEGWNIAIKHNLVKSINPNIDIFSILRAQYLKLKNNDEPVDKSVEGHIDNTSSTTEQPINEHAKMAKRVADKLYKEMSNARAQLFDLCNINRSHFENDLDIVNKRAILADKVIKLQYQVDEAYQVYRYALEHNKTPNTALPTENIDFDIYRKILNTRKYISLLKNKKEALTIKQQKKLEELNSELERLLIIQKNMYDRL